MTGDVSPTEDSEEVIIWPSNLENREITILFFAEDMRASSDDVGPVQRSSRKEVTRAGPLQEVNKGDALI